MDRTLNRMKRLNILTVVVAFAFTSSLSLSPDMALAKRGGDDNRARYYGIVQSKPAQGLHGDWLIGGRPVTTNPHTEFDQSEGALVVGSCAKVEFRNGQVHEIDSEPLRNCQ